MRIGEEAGGGTQIDDRAAPRRDQKRRGELRAEELAVDICLHRMRPLLRRHLIDAARRPRDPSVVYKEIKPAHSGLYIAEELLHIFIAGDVRHGICQSRHLLAAPLQFLRRAPADMHARAAPVKGGRDGLAYPIRPRRDENSFIF
ncbi:hypothetical protein SDC9_129545 [bioreactor metagenome]|uniref:Uncharacterized protein n=1 Tax=bioreactor metagenome TaxID=1076179 RepID=A0A645CZT9_9ZZZZ